MRVGPGLHLALSGAAGFDLSDRHDCHAWLIDTGAGWALFDAGAGRDTEAALQLIAASGVDPQDIRTLVLTHGHADHSGGAAGLRAALGLQVLAGQATARMVGSGDEAALGLDRARRSGVYPSDYVYRTCPVDRVVAADEAFSLGEATIRVIATPGHSHDHLCFLVTRAGSTLLIAGDALFWGGKVVFQDTLDCDVPATCASVRVLAGLSFDAFLPGHGAFSLRDGARHAKTALQRIERLLAPQMFG